MKTWMMRILLGMNFVMLNIRFTSQTLNTNDTNCSIRLINDDFMREFLFIHEASIEPLVYYINDIV